MRFTDEIYVLTGKICAHADDFGACFCMMCVHFMTAVFDGFPVITDFGTVFQIVVLSFSGKKTFIGSNNIRSAYYWCAQKRVNLMWP